MSTFMNKIKLIKVSKNTLNTIIFQLSTYIKRADFVKMTIVVFLQNLPV